MSVLVEGMNMPKSCFDCPISHPAYARTLICAINGKFIMSPICEKKRMDECPLVEPTTQHGRLIDADALLDLLNNCVFPSDMVTTTAVRMAMNWIKDSPTVIDAKDGE